MDDTNITLMEALYSAAAGHDGVDETNIIFKVRKAQQVVLDYTGQPSYSLFVAQPVEKVDDIMIMVTQNGHRDIFA